MPRLKKIHGPHALPLHAFFLCVLSYAFSLIRFLYPQDPLNAKLAEGPYQDEYQALRGLEVDCSRFDFDAIAFDEFSPSPRIQPGEAILYRGWMLNPIGYEALTKHIQNCGGTAITTTDHYRQCHHLKKRHCTAPCGKLRVQFRAAVFCSQWQSLGG